MHRGQVNNLIRRLIDQMNKYRISIPHTHPAPDDPEGYPCRIVRFQLFGFVFEITSRIINYDEALDQGLAELAIFIGVIEDKLP